MESTVQVGTESRIVEVHEAQAAQEWLRTQLAKDPHIKQIRITSIKKGTKTSYELAVYLLDGKASLAALKADGKYYSIAKYDVPIEWIV